MDISNTSILNTLSGTITRGRTPVSSTSDSHKAGPDHSVRPASPSADVVTISKAAHALNDEEVKAVDPVKAVGVEEEKTKTGQSTPSTQLSEEDLKQVQDLKKRDQEVRTHEQAHLAAAGKYATGGASYEYKRGPDGKNYAVGGEVGIDTSPIPNDPQATLQKAQQIRAAAQAPANPSSQDRQVAASATQMEAKARQEIAELALNGESSEAGVKKSGEDNDDNAMNNTEDAQNENNTKATSAYNAVSNSQSDVTSLIEAFA